MASNDTAVLAAERGFQLRVKYFMQKGAVAILAEDPVTAGHAQRVTYANSILAGTADPYQMAMAVLTNPTVAGVGKVVTDNDLEFAVNSMLNAFAGVETG